MARERTETVIPKQIRMADTFTAIWCPSWYDLDQALTVGKSEELLFAVDLSDQEMAEIGRWHSNQPDAVFFSGLLHDRSWFGLSAEVLELENSVLGPLRFVRSNGLDYTMGLMSGTEIVVNCEELPGAIWDEKSDSWQETTQSNDWTIVARIAQKA